MNEAAKAYIKQHLEGLDPGTEIDFDYGTKLGEEAARSAIQVFLFDNPESVTSRPLSAGTGT